MSSELNDIFPIPFSRITQFQCRLTPAVSALSAAAETKRGDYGSLRSQGLEEAALGRPGGQP